MLEAYKRGFWQARERLEQQKSEEVQKGDPEIVEKSEAPINEEPKSSKSTVGSINIWNKGVLVDDENFIVSKKNKKTKHPIVFCTSNLCHEVLLCLFY